jgi:hypothetical protein
VPDERRAHGAEAGGAGGRDEQPAQERAIAELGRRDTVEVGHEMREAGGRDVACAGIVRLGEAARGAHGQNIDIARNERSESFDWRSRAESRRTTDQSTL